MQTLQAIENLDDLLKEYRDNVCKKYEEVDPGSEIDWKDMYFGWSLAKGLNIDQANAFSSHVSYVLHDFASEIDYDS